jgi:hypothetical protein
MVPETAGMLKKSEKKKKEKYIMNLLIGKTKIIQCIMLYPIIKDNMYMVSKIILSSM